MFELAAERTPALQAIDEGFFSFLSDETTPRPLPDGFDPTTWTLAAAAGLAAAARRRSGRPGRPVAHGAAHARPHARQQLPPGRARGHPVRRRHGEHRADVRAPGRLEPRRLRGLHRAPGHAGDERALGLRGALQPVHDGRPLPGRAGERVRRHRRGPRGHPGGRSTTPASRSGSPPSRPCRCCCPRSAEPEPVQVHVPARRASRAPGRDPGTRPARTAANAVAPPGSTTCLARSHSIRMAATISSSVTVSAPASPSRRISNVIAPGWFASSASAIDLGCSTGTRWPASIDRRVSSAPAGSTP